MTVTLGIHNESNMDAEFMKCLNSRKQGLTLPFGCMPHKSLNTCLYKCSCHFASDPIFIALESSGIFRVLLSCVIGCDPLLKQV